ncbi:MAG: hypothetical protein PHD25_04960 [Bacteroidales bacterium]|nr:hypothetical protein [Bacteroidales bacterium]
MKKTNAILLSGLALMIIVLVPAKPLKAIPSFARKYQFSCQVCHAPAMPRLKAYGDDFAGAGFRLTDTEAPRYFVPVGDDKLSLLRVVPLALRFEGFLSYNYSDEKTADFGVPWGAQTAFRRRDFQKTVLLLLFFHGREA